MIVLDLPCERTQNLPWTSSDSSYLNVPEITMFPSLLSSSVLFVSDLSFSRLLTHEASDRVTIPFYLRVRKVSPTLSKVLSVLLLRRFYLPRSFEKVDYCSDIVISCR